MIEHRKYRHRAKPCIFYMPNGAKERLIAHIQERQAKGETASLQIVCGMALDLYAANHGLEPFNVRSMRVTAD